MKKAFASLIALLLALSLLAGCAAPAKSPASSPQDQQESGAAPFENAAYPYRFTDAAGHEVVLQSAPKRVAALMGSYAETWLLAGGELTGVTDDVVSERRLEVPKGAKVMGTVKSPNAEEVLALSPDFVILSEDLEPHRKFAETLKKANIPYAFFKVEYFSDYLSMLKICTDLTGRPDLYEKNGLDVQKQIDATVQTVKEESPKPTVLFIRAFSTGAKAKSGDNMVCRMLEDLGTDNIAARHESLLEDLSMEEILLENPDYIFVTTMGDEGKALEALKQGIQANPAWNSLKAVKNGRYVVLQKDLFHYKPNAKWGESYETLAKILYPQTFGSSLEP